MLMIILQIDGLRDVNNSNKLRFMSTALYAIKIMVNILSSSWHDMKLLCQKKHDMKLDVLI